MRLIEKNTFRHWQGPIFTPVRVVHQVTDWPFHRRAIGSIHKEVVLALQERRNIIIFDWRGMSEEKGAVMQITIKNCMEMKL